MKLLAALLVLRKAEAKEKITAVARTHGIVEHAHNGVPGFYQHLLDLCPIADQHERCPKGGVRVARFAFKHVLHGTTQGFSSAGFTTLPGGANC
jgi:hypothetical protein